MSQYSKKYNSFELGINKCGGGFKSDDTFNNLYVSYMIVGWKI